MTATEDLRPTLFGDLPMDAWPRGDDARGEPWARFVAARDDVADGDQDLAVRAWAGIAANPTLEARHRLQAWGFLRAIGVQPDPSVGRLVFGVVAEVAVDDAHDVLAAYDVGGARYLNHAGGASVVEDGPEPVVLATAMLVAAGQELADHIGPWTEPALPPLPVGHSRITLLTPSGHRFGQGPDDVLRADPAAAPLFAAATALLLAIVDLTA